MKKKNESCSGFFMWENGKLVCHSIHTQSYKHTSQKVAEKALSALMTKVLTELGK